MAAGSTAFLTKPIKQEVLLQAIKELSMDAPPSSKAAGRRKDTNLVGSNPKFAHLIPGFLLNRRQDVLTMREALARRDFETVERLAHSMKGAGASFGFQAITDLGAALEQEAGSADTDALGKYLDDLSTYLDGVELARPTAGGARRIVYVENDEDMRMLFRAVLEENGHHVQEARDGVEGLARILAEKPDVAFVDIGLPGMDGYEVARRVRAALGPSMLLVAMTGSAKESDRLQALSAGFDAHMTKPVELEMLKRILETKTLLTDASHFVAPTTAMVAVPGPADSTLLPGTIPS